MFKAKKSIIDIDLDLTELIGKEREDGGILKPQLETSSERVLEWLKEVKAGETKRKEENKRQKDAFDAEYLETVRAAKEEGLEPPDRPLFSPDQDMDEATASVISQIDFWYKEGKDFWLQKVPFPLLKKIMEHLNNQFFEVKKKSTK